MSSGSVPLMVVPTSLMMMMMIDVSQKVDYDNHLVDDIASIGYGPVSLLQSGSSVQQMHPWRPNSF